MFLFCLVFAMFCARLFICALWSPAGKGLTSWLSFVVSSVSLSLSHWYPGSGVVLDCIDSWSLHHYLLFFNHGRKQNEPWSDCSLGLLLRSSLIRVHIVCNFSYRSIFSRWHLSLKGRKSGNIIFKSSSKKMKFHQMQVSVQLLSHKSSLVYGCLFVLML